MGALGGGLFGLVICLITSRVLRQPRWFLPGSVLSSGLLGLASFHMIMTMEWRLAFSSTPKKKISAVTSKKAGHHDASELAIGRPVAGELLM